MLHLNRREDVYWYSLSVSVFHGYRRGCVDNIVGSYNLSEVEHAERACIIYDKSRRSSELHGTWAWREQQWRLV